MYFQILHIHTFLIFPNYLFYTVIRTTLLFIYRFKTLLVDITIFFKIIPHIHPKIIIFYKFRQHFVTPHSTTHPNLIPPHPTPCIHTLSPCLISLTYTFQCHLYKHSHIRTADNPYSLRVSVPVPSAYPQSRKFPHSQSSATDAHWYSPVFPPTCFVSSHYGA